MTLVCAARDCTAQHQEPNPSRRPRGRERLKVLGPLGKGLREIARSSDSDQLNGSRSADTSCEPVRHTSPVRRGGRRGSPNQCLSRPSGNTCSSREGVPRTRPMSARDRRAAGPEAGVPWNRRRGSVDKLQIEASRSSSGSFGFTSRGIGRHSLSASSTDQLLVQSLITRALRGSRAEARIAAQGARTQQAASRMA